eukprot:GHVP01036585.1.p1 GENE.GHVP01036585.1~~GHVP01036585.1.p1  ORF type:complete len:104 (-),score=6.39 GHVP01036585.1:260-571(-)
MSYRMNPHGALADTPAHQAFGIDALMPAHRNWVAPIHPENTDQALVLNHFREAAAHHSLSQAQKSQTTRINTKFTVNDLIFGVCHSASCQSTAKGKPPGAVIC